ncbi:BgTH12-02172 [Blumeria graminis f. sp. triticale]|uniref:BgTH12-02172 n=1 Tax=Blumeria graminis f. sp. triticale TaxID=1689686 RepID=A0A9W4D0X6_BLUGR|nr:BgTH12-02172 [Blumeria graminis f. sp. triticale]
MAGFTCVLAFLLYIPDLQTPTSRMVLVGNKDGPNYGVFHMPQSQHYPTPKSKNIIILQHQKSRKNTQLTAYCSATLDMNTIMNEISRGLRKLESVTDLKFSKDDAKYNRCKDTFQKLMAGLPQRKIYEHKIIEMHDLLRSDRCSSGEIARLSSEGLLHVTGDLSCFAPITSKNKDGQKIKSNYITRVKQDFWQSKAFIGWETSPKYALVWYQGYLHLFRPRIGKSIDWYLVTSVGNEEFNGKLIYEFIFKSVPKFRENLKILEKKKEQMLKGKKRFNIKLIFHSLYYKIMRKLTSRYVIDSLEMEIVDGWLKCPQKSKSANYRSSSIHPRQGTVLQ